MSDAFNPLDMANLAQSIVTRIEQMDPTPLNDVPSFKGAGVYAIYYTGNSDPYSQLGAVNSASPRYPVYVGKAVPAGGRRGLEAVEHTSTTALVSRIRQHAKSVQAADNLDIGDFVVRWLVVEDIWIPLGESAMIRRYRPVWNALLDGFGNHDPGKGRINGIRSMWDTVHPGRIWAVKYPARGDTAAQIHQDVRQYIADRLA
ncbi:Eco29kI family restriction endonuclease [Mycobacteroides abscessus]|uniref:Eco29kI family restriction endonuclease n=1 Tax=Mycobacteroides abscessus TaxID=36809 RepID=UPI0009A62829|nr:Eco29kI family restriction endonuclease [Mycobacteroides abscessus]MDO3068262.1 Eco29kI family restriction endonuclease [Mycobacteroides abscessus subsp. bolletii]SKN55802.1 Eco29kI restriction endonuclease [Mycobacteroides abscessus subsp. bolletii]SKX25609.1 Eco29kI restriction endonuclease [Mycobacteroides abscessus subsp. bolletii]